MATLSLFLKTVHDTVHVLGKKPSFSEPKIYTGGAKPSEWSRLSKKERDIALSKDWYVYWSFRDPGTGKLRRQPNIKAGANRYKTKRERYAHLRTLSRSLQFLLEQGFSPYADNSHLNAVLGLDGMAGRQPQNVAEKVVIEPDTGKGHQNDSQTGAKLLQPAIKEALVYKEHVLSPSSYSRFKSRTQQFAQWAHNNLGHQATVSQLDKKSIMAYLTFVLKRTSPRTHNNTKADLSSLFQFFEDSGHIPHNFVKGIRSLKSNPNLHKTYTPKQLQELEGYLEKNDPILLLFIRFVSYAFLRPIEVCRLRVGDLDIEQRRIYVQTKTKKRAAKILPDILLEHLPDLSRALPENHLFALHQIGGVWNTLEDNKRNHYSKQFKKAKDILGLGKEYGLYSYRHTFITKLYRKLVKKYPPVVAKGKLMLITGHATMPALEKYLRDINAELPEDYSHLFGEET
ncbi:tyrosine-type recombinase/integrase [Flagellimonas algicola]|uniref:Site-specific integrase n=1 Tax=Flagellimonas algicola TaxID=2583815 RepID=A0ABY2WLG2_9FLAO|nr:tyrosine-type recombinase/integrase [Allomuricauda algicola]TMU55676.1 site-specific integrase [Allomuricauda algicola]